MPIRRHRENVVANILVKNITMVDAENGARIKAFGGGTGYARDITFQDFKCESVIQPITIDQRYETSASTCASYPSGVQISDIHYINVTGTGRRARR